MTEPRAELNAEPKADVVRVLHISDIHCGRPFRAEHVAAAEAIAKAKPLNAIAVSGDLTQFARIEEFQCAQGVIQRLKDIAPVLVVPGNHDTQWWYAPFGIGNATRIHERYRTYIHETDEPTLRLPGLSVVGLNSAQGMLPHAVGWYPRDWRVKGGISDAQFESAEQRLNDSPPGDLRVLVVHHNLHRGALSNRWGLKRPYHALRRITDMHPHVVCTGHDHEERVEVVQAATGSFILSGANTLSSRMRGHRASALNVIEATPDSVTVSAWTYVDGAFVTGKLAATIVRNR